MANVAVFTNQNMYRYTEWQLLLAYGLAALFSFLSALLGFWCLHENEGAYWNNFSTLLRVTRDSKLQSIIRDDDTLGVAPVPKYLESLKIGLFQITDKHNLNIWYAIQPSAWAAQSPMNTTMAPVVNMEEENRGQQMPLLDESSQNAQRTHRK
jgi:hypothetical protein